MKANLKRKMTIARELAAAGEKLTLDTLNWHKRDGDKPRRFTKDLTTAQKNRARIGASVGVMS